MLGDIPAGLVHVVLTLVSAIHKLISAGEDSNQQEAALMDLADEVAEELKRRKFGA